MSFGMVHCVNRETVTGVLKDHGPSSLVYQIILRKTVTSRPRQDLFYELLDPRDLYLQQDCHKNLNTRSSVTGQSIVHSGVDE
jgi:hypothetical protein